MLSLLRKFTRIFIKIPPHPILLSIFNALYYFIGFEWSISKWDLILVCLVSIVFAVLVWLLMFSVSGKRYKSAIVASMIILLFFQLDTIYESLIDIAWFPASVNAFLTTIPGQYTIFLIMILLIVSFVLMKNKKDFKIASLFLDFMSVALIVFSFFQMAKYQNYFTNIILDDGKSLIQGWSEYLTTNAKNMHPTESFKGDIYYILFDGFGDQQTLDEVYGCPNNDLFKYLHARGFKVVENAATNYNQTRFSMSSALNLDFIQNIKQEIHLNDEDVVSTTYLMNKNLIFEFLRREGYKTVTFSTGLGSTEITASDNYLSPANLPHGYINEVINNSFLSLFFWKQQYRWHTSRVDFTIEELSNLDAMNSPIFVYAHIMIPHPPFVFQANGEKVFPFKKFDLVDNNAFVRLDSQENYVDGYCNQATFISTKIIKIIDEIQSTAHNAVIIIQGDHGPGAFFNQENQGDSNINEKFHILNAYYFPDGDYSAISEDITPVNSFRVVLNHYFGTNLDMLPNSSYYSGYILPFDFEDVTGEIR